MHPVSVAIDMLVGLVALVMAAKSLRARKLLPFHEQASGASWEALDERLKLVVLAILRVSGLGFLVVAAYMLVLPPILLHSPSRLLVAMVPAPALAFTAGLFVVNYRLHRKTGAATPWKGSAAAALALAAGMVLSFLMPS